MMDILILGPTFYAFAVTAVDMVWIATLAASATSCKMYSMYFLRLVFVSCF